MPTFFFLLLMGLLALVVYQDFRYRALSALVLAGLFTVAMGFSVYANGWRQALVFMGANLLLTAIQLAGVAGYFSLRHRKFVNIINTYLGSGDIWFYATLACAFSPMNFVLFNLTACLIILIVYALARGMKPDGRTIPFAGCLALAMMAVIAAGQIFHALKPYDDGLLFSFFIKA